MKTYIFYTADGFTENGYGEEIENCQVLDWVTGDDVNKAFQIFKKKNKYLLSEGFHDVMCQEVKRGEVYYFSIDK